MARIEHRDREGLFLIGITLTIEHHREHQCLYVQKLMPSGEIFYLGICKLSDVYRCPDAYRNTYWRKTINDNTLIQTTVISTSSEYGSLYNQLNEYVKLWKPIANLKGYQQSSLPSVITCVEGDNAGQTYQTQQRCAEANGITQPALSNHLNGRPGYDTVRGMKFKRGYLT